LGALIPTAEGGNGPKVVDVRDSPFREVSIESVSVNPLQPRKLIKETELAPLADSIRELGVLQPLLVRGGAGGDYELIAGERRWRAAKLAGLETVPVIVREADNVHSLEQALVENLHRQDLNALDEAAAYRQLIDDFSMTHDEVGTRVGKSRAAITNLLRLLQLAPKVQALLASGELSEGHARALLGTDDASFQLQLAGRVAREGLSVRAVEDSVRLRNELTRPSSKRRKVPVVDSPALDWQERLRDRLDTRVTISVGGRRGRIVIEFADADDLERVASVIEGDTSTSI